MKSERGCCPSQYPRDALVKYVVGGEPSCGFLDTDGQTWPDQIAAVTG